MNLPAELHDEFGFELHKVQVGSKPRRSKSLKGELSGVVELIADHDGDTFRTVYTVKLEGVLYVLHAFKKKSKSGIATPPKDVALIKRRLAAARADHEANR